MDTTLKDGKKRKKQFEERLGQYLESSVSLQKKVFSLLLFQFLCLPKGLVEFSNPKLILRRNRRIRPKAVPDHISLFCYPMDCSPPRLLCPWDFPGKSTEVGCHFLLQRIFPTQGLNPCLLHWQADSLPLSHLGNPYNTYRITYTSI